MTHNQEVPCAKIKIIKSNNEGEKEFIVTPEGNFEFKQKIIINLIGVVKSEKNTTIRDIMIGRQQSTSEVKMRSCCFIKKFKKDDSPKRYCSFN